MNSVLRAGVTAAAVVLGLAAGLAILAVVGAAVALFIAALVHML